VEIIERFRAAPNERRMWVLTYGALAVWVVAYGLWIRALPWTAPLVVIGLLIVPFSIAQELYRQVWGTVGLMAIWVFTGLAILALLGTGVLVWAPAHLVGPALCLGGAVFAWRYRPTENERFLVPAQVSKYIGRLQSALRRVTRETPFHAVLDRTFLGQVDQAATWLAEVYDSGAKGFGVTALSVEMIGFDINTDQWSLECFAFSMPRGELFEDLEYNLAEYEDAEENEFILVGMEDLQAAYEQTDIGDLLVSEAPQDKQLLEAVSIASDLVTARMQELIAAAHREASRRGHPVGRVPVFANSHDSLWLTVCCPGRRRARPTTARDA